MWLLNPSIAMGIILVLRTLPGIKPSVNEIW